LPPWPAASGVAVRFPALDLGAIPRHPPGGLEKGLRVAAALCGWAWRPPWPAVFDDRVENQQELAHDRKQSELALLASGAQRQEVIAHYHSAACAPIVWKQVRICSGHGWSTWFTAASAPAAAHSPCAVGQGRGQEAGVAEPAPPCDRPQACWRQLSLPRADRPERLVCVHLRADHQQLETQVSRGRTSAGDAPLAPTAIVHQVDHWRKYRVRCYATRST
jgi:hypothetical protein